jgi:hypothetical protein
MSVSSKKFAGERGYARIQGNVSAASKRACKFRCRRGREPSEKAAGQTAAIVDHDWRGELATNADCIWNHSNF